MPYKQKDTKYWTIRVPNGNGSKTRRSSGTTNFKEAKALELKLNAEEYNLQVWGQEPERVYDVLMEAYLSETEEQDNYTRNFYSAKNLTAHFTGMVLNDLSGKTINDYKRKRKASDGTIRKELILLASAINYARENWGWKIENPIKGKLPPKPKGRLRWITESQADTLIESAENLSRSKYLANLIRLALNTGMRKGEMLYLEWNRVDFVNRMIYLEPGHQKNKSFGSVALNAGAISALKAQIGKHDKWVFYYRKSRIKDPKKAFFKACSDAGISDFHFHDLRHTFAAWAVQRGIPIKTLQELMRHEDITSTMIYAHLAPENLRDAIDLMTYDKTMTTGSQIKVVSDVS